MRASRKRRLIAALTRERDALPPGSPSWPYLDWQLRALHGRGSGPLPQWARAAAERRGL